MSSRYASYRRFLPKVPMMAVNALLVLLWGHLALAHPQSQLQSSQHVLQQNDNSALSGLLSHNDEPYVFSKSFNFDPVERGYADNLYIQENISSTIFPAGISGGIKFVAGDAYQKFPFIILVQISSWNEEALDFVSIGKTNRGLFVNSTTPEAFLSSGISDSLRNGLSVGVDIIVFVKPNALQFGHTNVYTPHLDIDLWPGLNFETFNMALFAERGSISGIESLRFTAHSMIVHTEEGSISGNWSLPAAISFVTHSGDIDINLVPKRWSSGPNTRGDLHAWTGTGDIAIRMPLQASASSLRNGTTFLQAEKGSITGTLVHGAVTSLKAHNHINATLLPHWAFYTWQGVQHNFITTQARYGNTTLNVLPPIIDSYYKINPLFFAISKHTQGPDSTVASSSPTAVISPHQQQKHVLHMNLTYPGQWAGVASGLASPGGTVNVSGEDFDVLERTASVIRVQRRPLGSQMVFGAGEGSAELTLEGCKEVGCGFPRS